jgi:hypothetical protein
LKKKRKKPVDSHNKPPCATNQPAAHFNHGGHVGDRAAELFLDVAQEELRVVRCDATDAADERARHDYLKCYNIRWEKIQTQRFLRILRFKTDPAVKFPTVKNASMSKASVRRSRVASVTEEDAPPPRAAPAAALSGFA